MHRPARQEKAHELLNLISCLASVASSSAQVTMQSPSAQETMQSQNCRRARAWTEREVRDLIAVWGNESLLAELRFKRQNAKIFEKISNGMKDRGYNSDPQQCRVEIKELRQAYQKKTESQTATPVQSPRHPASMMSCMPSYGMQPPLPQPWVLTPSKQWEATWKQVLGARKMMMRRRLLIAHSKEAEKPVSPIARIRLSPLTWNQYPRTHPRRAPGP
ncbi:Putative protein C11orf61 like protein [Chelonia mydas]|uniref:Myb/SANT-like DNA-binding domain-containing protein n=1 Tax=Chelonia mydas TaxID=8469 RepID=M7APM9_CHEMY|nr:Putative protein C11orf61 like protein [Chelonia mydas]